MSLFTGARSSQARTPPTVVSALRVQRSVNGAAVPVVYGTARLAGNLIWYGDLVANPVKSGGGKSGGKGGAGGGSSKGQPGSYTYQASFAVALCSGPIQGIGQVWDTSGTADTPPSLSGSTSIMQGAAGQAPWGYLTSAHPDQALGYSGLAYVGIAAMALGDSPGLPNLSFEVVGLGPAAAPSSWAVPPSAHAWTVSYSAPSYPSAPFAAIAAVLKTPAATQNIVFDTSPAFCFADLLTSTSYGAGFAPALIGDLTAYATWCQAAGLSMSAALTEQRACRDIMRDWLDATLADAFWSQGQVKIGVYADQAATGTAADGSALVFTPALAPVMTIDDSLMLMQSSDAGPLTVSRKDPAEAINRVTVEYSDRDSDYNTVTVNADDAAHIATYGLRPAPNVSADFITVGAVASRIADMRLARATGVLATYEWRMRSPGELLEPFDVVAVTDTALGLVDFPVRVTAVEEEDDTVFHIAAEDIPGLIGAMAARPLVANAGFQAGWNADPGNVNAPIVFEPPSPLTVSGSGLEIWAMVSGANLAEWGGCQVWASTDGESYALVGTIEGAARMGALTAPLASVAASLVPPTVDNADTLAVNLSESGGSLLSTSQAGMLALNTLCYCDGELLAYQTATLTGTNAYALTGLARGALGSQIGAPGGGAHATGSAFARLDGAQFRYPFTPDRIGQTVYFKFLSFNIYGGGQQTLDEVEPYAYTIRGTALAEDPANVTGLAAFYSATNGQTYLTWNGVADPRPQLDYELRLGSSWSAGQVIGRFKTAPAPILGDGDYWLAAHYKVPNGPDVYSPTPASIAVAGSQLTTNIVASRNQAAEGWPGTMTNTALNGANLVLLGAGNVLADPDIVGTADVIYYGGVASSGSYQIPAGDRVDVGRVTACNVIVKLGALIGYDIGAVDITQAIDLRTVGDVLGVDTGDHVWATPQIRISLDGLTWGAWQNWVPGSYVGMAFDCQVLLFSNNPGVACVLTGLTFEVDIPTVTFTGSNVAVAAAGTAVAFPATLNGGPGGAALPNIQVEIVSGAQSGDTVVIAPAADLYYADTTAILNFNGNIADYSPAANTYANHGAVGFAASPGFAGADCLGPLNGSSQYLSTAASPLAFGTGNFTIETFVDPTRTGQASDTFIGSGTGGHSIRLGQTNGAYTIYVVSDDSGYLINPGTIALTPGVLTHVAYVRNGTTGTLWVGGVSAGTCTDTNNYAGAGFGIGAYSTGAEPWAGYFGPTRLTDGVARYAAPFAPPAAFFPTTAGAGPNATTLAGFTVQILNGGVPVAGRTIDWQAQGY